MKWVLALLILSPTYGEEGKYEKGYYHIEPLPYVFNTFNGCRSAITRRDRRPAEIRILDSDILLCIQRNSPTL